MDLYGMCIQVQWREIWCLVPHLNFKRRAKKSYIVPIMPIKSMPTGLSRVYWLGQAFLLKEKLSQKIIRSVKEKPLQIVPL